MGSPALTLLKTSAAFDAISRRYDATRAPLDEATCGRVASALRGAGATSLVEVGVGTGRIAAPLIAHGFELTGVDPSLGMLRTAREKQVTRLVRGDAARLPFADRSFDLALFVHVLHLVDDPLAALREGERVGRLGAAALVEPADAGRPDPLEVPETNPRQIVYDELRRQGVSVPSRAGGPRTLDRRLLERFPPDRLVTVDEREVTELLARQLEVIEHGASRWTLDVPPELLAPAVAEARRRIGDRSCTYRRVRALAFWSPRSHTGP